MRVAVAALLLGPAALAQAVDLQYRHRPGAVYSYLTKVDVSGSIAASLAGGPEQQSPIRLSIEDRTECRVVELLAGGAARIEVRLRALHLSADGPAAMAFDLAVDDEDKVTITTGGQEFTGTVPRPEEPLDETPAALGLTRGQLLEITVPAVVRVAASGEITEQAEPLWPEKLKDLPTVGQVLATVRGGAVLPPALPGESLAYGQSWEQTRLVSMPGGDATFELPLTYTLEDKETLGAFDCARIGFVGDAVVEEQAFDLEPTPGMVLAMTMKNLHQEVTGKLFYDPAAGSLVEQRSDSTIGFLAASQPGAIDVSLKAELKVHAVTMLLKAAGGDEAAPAPAEAAP